MPLWPFFPLLSRPLAAAATAITAVTTTTTATPPKPNDPALLVRLCTILYQGQNLPDRTLHPRLASLTLPPGSAHHELFLQVCSRFPLSWRPVHRLLLFLSLPPLSFSHSPATFSRFLSILSSSHNVSLLHSTLLSSSPRLLSPSALRAAARGLAAADEVSKCAHLVTLSSTTLDSSQTLTLIAETICKLKLPAFAEKVISRAQCRFGVAPSGEVYEFLIVAYCRAGEFAEACRIWNRMERDGIEAGAPAYREIVVTLFKGNRVGDAMMVFDSMRRRRLEDVDIACYRAVVSWLCKEGRVASAYMVFGEMVKRGVGVDCCEVLGDLVYGLLARRKVREGYRVFYRVSELDISLYHGLIKGLVRLKRAGEATRVFREMIWKGCEPNMHTYIMLLQGHLGKRGRKGRDPLVNFASIFVGGLVKAGRTLEATKYAERMMWGGVEVPRFDYNKFLYYFSNEEGVVMFEEVGKRLREVGLVDLGDIFLTYGERMATRDRRRRAMNGFVAVS